MSREIDALIAEKLMGYCVWPRVIDGGESPVGSCGTVGNRGGWADCNCPCGKRRWFGMDDDAHYSTDIASAWEVVDKIVGDQYEYKFELERLTGRVAPGRWFAYFYKGLDRFSGHGEDAPMAICLAALKSVGVEVPA